MSVTAPARHEAREHAINLASKGIPVFPCLGNKRPATPNGYKDSVRDPEAIARLWRLYPGLLIGVATGSLSGLAVVDVDLRDDGIGWLEDNFDELPVTRVHETRSGGFHLFYQHRNGVRNSVGKIAPGVDVRGD